jgi:hypothetical protein
MVDDFSEYPPDEFEVSDEQMGLWDMPPEPPDLWDEPPYDDGLMPEEPSDFEDAMPPELYDVEPSDIDEPFDESYKPDYGLPAEPESSTSSANVWERYLDSFSPNKNPDVLEAEQRDRAQTLNLLDARFIGIEYQNDHGEPTGYGVGCIELYADPTQESGPTGRYLEIATFADPLAAAALYDTLQTPVDKGWIADYAVYELADFAAADYDTPDTWREATADEQAIYGWYAAFNQAFDQPIEDTIDSPQSKIESTEQTDPVFHALSTIGIQAADFDPVQEPPPFYDPTTETAYWIGIFQADLEDPSNCIASVLSLGRNPESGELEAQLAPCVPGDWDKAFESSQHLLMVMERDGLDACFLAAESMAIATDQRDLWETERGMPLEPDYAEQAAEYTREAFDIEL